MTGASCLKFVRHYGEFFLRMFSEGGLVAVIGVEYIEEDCNRI